MRPSAPRQSKYAVVLPLRLGQTLFAARSMRWIAIEPISSPLYTFAAGDASEKDPIILPLLSLHSRINAAEHNPGQTSLM